MDRIRTISPADGSVVAERPYAGAATHASAHTRARAAQRDYLDPALAWTGVKDSGRGCTLSRVGYEALTRPKSFHLRLSG